MKPKKTSEPVFEADSHVLDAGDMRPEYDFSKGVRGKHYKDLSKGYTSIVNHPDGTKEITHYRPIPDMIHLAPDVRRYFPDSDAVNVALRGLIRPHLQRSSFFVSSRITDWSVPGVQQTVEDLLLKPLCDAEPSRDAAKSANTDTLEVNGSKNVSSIPLEVYCLDPLSEADAKRYAEAHGAKPVEAFWQAVEEGGYEFMASRPLDLEWMVKQRIASKKLGTYAELIETAVTYRLRETNQSYIDSGAVLSPERLREGAELSSWPSFHLSSPRPVSAKRYACSMQPTPVWGHKRGGRRGGVFHPFMNIPFEIVPSQLFRAGRSRASPQNILEGAAYNPS